MTSNFNPCPKPKRIKLSSQKWQKLRKAKWDYQLGRCAICNEPVKLHGQTVFDTAHLAHIKSKGSGGGDTWDNTRILCYGCHFGPKEHGLSWTRDGKGVD